MALGKEQKESLRELKNDLEMWGGMTDAEKQLSKLIEILLREPDAVYAVQELRGQS